MSAPLVAVACAAATGVGLVCKSVDHADSVPLRTLRCTNSFSAGYSLLLFVLSLDWLVLGLARGSWRELRAVLSTPPRGMLRAEDVASGERICVLVLAYMVQDLTVRILYRELDVRYVLHHSACLLGLAMVLVLGHPPIYCVALTLSELSTPVVCLFEVADMERGALQRWIEPCGVLLNLLFPLRCAWFAWTFYLWIAVVRTEPLLAPTLDNLGFLSVAILLLVNFSWWSKLLWGTAVALLDKLKQGRPKQL